MNLQSSISRSATIITKILLFVFRPVIGPARLREVSNKNQTRLINFTNAKVFKLCSIYFSRKNIHKYKRKLPNRRTHDQIDHIIINRCSGCIRNVKTYREDDIDSDHYLGYAKYILSLSTK